MTERRNTWRATLAAGLLTATCSSLCQPALGQSEAGPPGACAPQREVGAGSLDQLTWNRLSTIYEDVGAELYDEAYDELHEMLARVGRDRYLQAILNQALGQVEWARGNYDPALGYFEQAVELDTLPDQAHFAMMLQLAQLHFMEGRLDDALQRLDLWFCAAPAEQVTAAAYVLQASIYAQQGQFPGALEAINSAIAMDGNPQESWYRLKLAAHYELEQYPQAAGTLEELIARWPHHRLYWVQLSQIHYKLKREERALAVLALAHRRGLLDQQADLTFLSGLYRQLNIPFKAAEVLEQGIRDGIVQSDKRHWLMAAEAWYAAAELDNSLAAYARAGQNAVDGLTDLRRGYILVDLERWSAALDALNHAFAKGGLNESQSGEAYLLRGLARFKLGDFDGAGADWSRAGRYEPSREAASQWIDYLRMERERRAS
jgi:tetratricopeptide (TPR) repeat protein